MLFMCCVLFKFMKLHKSLEIAMSSSRPAFNQLSLVISSTTNDELAFTIVSSMKNSLGGNTTVEIILLALQIVIGCIGVIANGIIVIIIVGFTSMHKQLGNVFVVNQNIIDCLSSLLLICQTSSSFAMPILVEGQLVSEMYCRLWHSGWLHWSLFISSTYNVVVLTIERYLKIVHPIVHKNWFTLRRAKILLAVIWLLGFAFEVAVVVSSTTVRVSQCLIVAVWPNVIIQQMSGCFQATAVYFIPTLVFIFCYSKMIRALRRVGPRKESGNLEVFNTAIESLYNLL